MNAYCRANEPPPEWRPYSNLFVEKSREPYVCKACGSTQAAIDYEKRALICLYCDNETRYPEDVFSGLSNTVFAKEKAVQCFLDGQYDWANHFAAEVACYSKNNVSSSFITCYYDEFCRKRAGTLHRYLLRLNAMKSLHPSEADDLRKLICGCAPNLLNYESDILHLIINHMQTVTDRAELEHFLDAICPYFIKNSHSIRYLDLYLELAQNYAIPKTCFAFLVAIRKKHESSFLHNDLQTYMEKVGFILESSRENIQKPALIDMYNSICYEFGQQTRGDSNGK